MKLLLKKISRLLAVFVVPFLGSLLMRFLYLTNKKVFNVPENIGEEPVIFSCWHGELLMLPFLYRRYRKNPHAQVLISPHFDGVMISKTVENFGLNTIAGSSNKNPARTLIQAMKSLKNGWDIGITPDGPKGPRHEVADGIVVMAQKTNTKIALLNVKPTSYWQLSSWDKFIIPKPFGTLYYYADLVDVSNMELHEAKKMIKEGLLKHEL